jgi:hypothetical protein
MTQNFWLGNLKGRNHLGDLVEDGRIIYIKEIRFLCIDWMVFSGGIL